MKKLFACILILAFLTMAVIASSSTVVYITKHGDKYHTSDCRFLKKSRIPINLGIVKAKL